MQWAFIVPIILLAAGLITVAIFSLRQSYKIALDDISGAANELRALTRAHADLYDRTYALVFFFGNDVSEEKAEFTLPDSPTLQELFDANTQIDFEISLLNAKIDKSETLMKERGASIKSIGTELEQIDISLISLASTLNRRISWARRISSFKLSKYLLTKLDACTHEQIIFREHRDI